MEARNERGAWFLAATIFNINTAEYQIYTTLITVVGNGAKEGTVVGIYYAKRAAIAVVTTLLVQLYLVLTYCSSSRFGREVADVPVKFT